VFLIGHIAAGVIAVLTGAAAMLAPKTPGRHPRRGTAYLAALTTLVATAAGLGVLAWPRDTHLLVLAGIALALGALGYTARKVRRAGWPLWHITGMGGSYILILTAFYVDNGPNLPLWNLLPPISFWFLPAAVGTPLLLRALHRHARRTQREGGTTPPTDTATPG